MGDEDMLIYGGDVCDRGPGCFRLVQTFTELEKTYGSSGRFVMIMGNRDTNKFPFIHDLNVNLLNEEGWPQTMPKDYYPVSGWTAPWKGLVFKSDSTSGKEVLTNLRESVKAYDHGKGKGPWWPATP